MKNLIKISVVVCCVMIITSSLFISCKYLDDNAFSNEKVADPSVSKDANLMANQEVESIESVENTDTLTAIFNEDESENIAANAAMTDDKVNNSASDSKIVVVSNNKKTTTSIEKSKTSVSTKIVDNSSNPVVASKITEKAAPVSNPIRNSGTKIITISKNAKSNTAKKAKSEIKDSSKDIKEETEEERNYRLQKANHTIPDL